METAAFEFRNVRKTFGSVIANENVSFAVAAGTIHGVVGENGAGKSTIMKCLYGMHEPDDGQILVGGAPCRIANPHRALDLGIGMVHQHFMLVPTLSVWENVVLGREPRPYQKAAIVRQLDELQRRFGFHLDLEAIVETLPVGMRQQVEILKLLYRDSKILILDEPTAVLTPPEVDALFTRMRLLRDAGKTIVLITHKLREILTFTERVTVMRQGRVVDDAPTAGLTETALAEKIIGRKRAGLGERPKTEERSAILEVRDLRVTLKNGRRCLDGVSFSVRPGEILGIAGVEGNGQHELVEILALARRDYEGSVIFDGRPLTDRKTYETKQQGLAVIPSDRHEEGLVLPFSVADNVRLGHHREPRFTRGHWLVPAKLLAETERLLDAFDVRPRRADLPIAALSGGNQQKVILGREMNGPIKLVIAAHPTRGVDIGAIEFIHGQFLELRRQGAAIVLVSSELEEIFALSDRIAVLYGGQLVGETGRVSAVESQIGLWMTRGSA